LPPPAVPAIKYEEVKERWHWGELFAGEYGESYGNLTESVFAGRVEGVNYPASITHNRSIEVRNSSFYFPSMSFRFLALLLLRHHQSIAAFHYHHQSIAASPSSSIYCCFAIIINLLLLFTIIINNLLLLFTIIIINLLLLFTIIVNLLLLFTIIINSISPMLFHHLLPSPPPPFSPSPIYRIAARTSTSNHAAGALTSTRPATMSLVCAM
jgi:hypothetical protein